MGRQTPQIVNPIFSRFTNKSLENDESGKFSNAMDALAVARSMDRMDAVRGPLDLLI